MCLTDSFLLLTQPCQSSEPQLERLSLKNSPKSDHKSEIEIQLETLEARLRTVQLALEILTGASAVLPDPEPHPSTAEEEDNEGTDFAPSSLNCLDRFCS
jgi:hypothetical protein